MDLRGILRGAGLGSAWQRTSPSALKKAVENAKIDGQPSITRGRVTASVGLLEQLMAQYDDGTLEKGQSNSVTANADSIHDEASMVMSGSSPASGPVEPAEKATHSEPSPAVKSTGTRKRKAGAVEGDKGGKKRKQDTPWHSKHVPLSAQIAFEDPEEFEEHRKNQREAAKKNERERKAAVRKAKEDEKKQQAEYQVGKQNERHGSPEPRKNSPSQP